MFFSGDKDKEKEMKPMQNMTTLRRLDEDSVNVLDGCRDYIKKLWADDKVQELLRARKMRLEHEAGFFLDDVDRIARPNYEPTDLDVCKARLKTVGVTETSFQVRNGPAGVGEWIVYDVGGSRTQRHIWEWYFDCVSTVLFLAPISAFDQRLDEDPTLNRLEDSLLLWKTVCSSKLLARVSLILFLNKTDVLRNKLGQGIRVSKYLTNYKGLNELEPVCKYFEKKFMAIYKEAQRTLPHDDKAPERMVRTFHTSVLDLKSTKNIIWQVQDYIFSANAREASIL